MRKKSFWFMVHGLRFQAGFTLTELLIAVAILAIVLGIVIFANLGTSVTKAYDANRKNDLSNIRRAFEEYYNDNNCYPNPSQLAACNGNQLSPYLKKVPCDPQTRQPYQVETSTCTGFRILTLLKDKEDPAIRAAGCDPIQGCGFGPATNYGVSDGMTVTAPGFVAPTPTPTGGQTLSGQTQTPTVTPQGVGSQQTGGTITPTNTPTRTPTNTATPTQVPSSAPTPTPAKTYACAPWGRCNEYLNPQQSGCPVIYSDPLCLNQCGNSANLCKQ